jgi:hypothetical protein
MSTGEPLENFHRKEREVREAAISVLSPPSEAILLLQGNQSFAASRLDFYSLLCLSAEPG